MDDLPPWLPLLITRLNRIEAILMKSVGIVEETITMEEAMKLFGYSNRTSFMNMVRSKKVPFIKINAKKYAFEPAAIRDWRIRNTRNA